MLIFIVGLLTGLTAGGALCVRFIRREIAADIGPRLKQVQIQLGAVESQLDLAIMTRYAELARKLPGEPPKQLP